MEPTIETRAQIGAVLGWRGWTVRNRSQISLSQALRLALARSHRIPLPVGKLGGRAKRETWPFLFSEMWHRLKDPRKVGHPKDNVGSGGVP